MSGTLGDPMMAGLFRAEVETHAATLNAGLLALEKNPSETGEVSSLMRAAHSVKGAARVVNIEMAVHLAHAMEDIFVGVQSGTVTLDPNKIDILLEGADTLARIGQLASDETYDDLMALADTAGRLAAKIASVKSAAPAEPAAKPTPQPIRPDTAGSDTKEPVATVSDKDAHKDSVRVSTKHLNSLMDLAAESMVRGRSLESFSNSLHLLRKDLSFVRASMRDLHQSMVTTGDRNQERMDAACNGLCEFEEKLETHSGSFSEFAFGFGFLSTRIHQEAMNSRMRPFGDGVIGFPRMVRDIAKSLGKKVRFEVVGSETSVDRDILEQLKPPVTHLLRNALDHGIEDPEIREKAGKPGEGHLILHAQHHQGMLSVTVSDDGRGIDVEKVRLKIVARNLTDPATALKLSRDELLQFLFLPGFSTASTVTEISGRGVGMDVVHNMAQMVGGTVTITTEKGRGTAIRLLMPVTLSVVRALVFEVAGELYAFCLSHIARCLRAGHEDAVIEDGSMFLYVEGGKMPLVEARHVLALETAAPENPTSLNIIEIGEGPDRTGIVVDRYIGGRSLVVRHMDQRLGPTSCIAAAALMEDGMPVLILDVPDMIATARKTRGTGREHGTAEQAGGPLKRILVVEDSITVREMERKLFESHGYTVDTAVDGLDGWNALSAGRYDLLITDVDMPRMNGIVLVTKIRADSRFAGLPIIIVSYKDREEDRETGMKAGANYYMTKNSFHDDTVIRMVRKILGDVAVQR